jgi:hypothetical protein
VGDRSASVAGGAIFTETGSTFPARADSRDQITNQISIVQGVIVRDGGDHHLQPGRRQTPDRPRIRLT